MQFNTQGDTKLRQVKKQKCDLGKGKKKKRQVKFQFGCLHLPPLNPDPMAAKTRRGLGWGAWSWAKLQWLAQQMGKGGSVTSSQSE